MSINIGDKKPKDVLMEFESQKEKEVAYETRESVKATMLLADLQEKLLGLDMKRVSVDDIHTLFSGHENNETASNLKENILTIKEIRKKFSDAELFEQFYGFKPVGRFTIRMTPVSFSVYLFDLRDWKRVNIHKRLVIHERANAKRKTIDLTPDENESHLASVQIDSFRACFKPSENIRAHEQRHSLNNAAGFIIRNRRGFGHDAEEKHINQLRRIAYDILSYHLTRLKDEIAARIVGGTSKQVLLGVIFRFAPKFGIYNFHDMPEDFWLWVNNELGAESVAQIKADLRRRPLNVRTITERSYEAVDLLEQKGYSRRWAVSYLSANKNLTKDWLELAQKCPAKKINPK